MKHIFAIHGTLVDYVRHFQGIPHTHSWHVHLCKCHVCKRLSAGDELIPFLWPLEHSSCRVL